ncbi:MAG: c-type cytochrome [Flavobacteriaceae bacterium]|nr:c-type cytochrome [Flavobacteriaceae bacterium]
MKKHSLANKIIYLSLAFLLFLSFSISAQSGDYDKGKQLYNANCAACHKLDKKLIGPALANVADRRSKEWLHSWIKDNNALRASGDADAKALFEEFNGMPMMQFPQFSTQDIDDILTYTSGKPKEGTQKANVAKVDPMVVAGKKLFQANCAACHKLDKKLIGPALANVADRRSKEWLHAWITDNNALRASGDADAKALFEEFNGMPMMPFPQFSAADIDNILAYTSAGDTKKVTAVAAKDDNLAKPKASTAWMSILISLVLLGLIIWIFVKSNNGFLKIVATIFLLFGAAYIGFGALFQVGIDTGYQPIQPIQFSHKIHAGDNKINCQYCHSSAKNSKTSGIPTLNVCMNCHKNISDYNGPVTSDKDKAFYDGEIQKIYDAIGWDKDNVKYIEGYKQKPVKWVRIHNLADFAYFNHSQHVTVAGLACQKCHGPVQTMEEVRQYSKLTMGWCLDCHKKTEVNMKNNGYYKNIHAQLSKKYGVEKVTVAQMGGQECGKCHY